MFETADDEHDDWKPERQNFTSSSTRCNAQQERHADHHVGWDGSQKNFDPLCRIFLSTFIRHTLVKTTDSALPA